MFKKTRIAIGITLLSVCAASFYNLINPTREIGRGTFADSQTNQTYEYALFESGNSRALSAWPEGSFPIIAPINITDSNLDGIVDSEGLFGRRIDPKKKERAQRWYTFALENRYIR